MKKFILFALMLICSSAYAADMSRVETVFDEDIVETGTTITSRMFAVQSSDEMGAWFEATPQTSVARPCVGTCGSPMYTIEMEMSPTDLSADFTKPIGMYPLAYNVTAATARTVDIYSVPMKYARFKFTNNAATHDTVVSMKLFTRDK